MSLESAFRIASPRLHPRRIAPLGLAIVALVAVFWLLAFVSAFRSYSLAAWSMGVAFIVYDLAQLVFVAVAARRLFAQVAPDGEGRGVSLGVVVAAYNEAAALGPTLDALIAQSSPPDQIVVADDGSDDGGAAVLAARYGLVPPPLGGLAQSPTTPTLFWLRLPHRGKARALNAALAQVTTEIVVTVDADTILAPEALAHMQNAFACDPALIVAGGCWSRAAAATRSPRRCRRSSATNMCAISSPVSRGRGWNRCC